MKKLIAPIFMCFVAIAASAQSKAEIEVSYTAHKPNLRNGKDDLTNQYVLLANASESKFYSPRTEYIDSLNSTPNGKAQYDEMAKSAFFSGKMKDIPKPDGSYYIVKSGQRNTLTYYDKVGTERYYYEEAIPEIKWEVGDSTKIIFGYECFVATADFHGRHWTAWFSPEIPLNAGPWKLGGLPGLILEAVCDDGLYSFVADGIQQIVNPITPVYLVDQYEKTSRESFLKAKRGFIDNPLGKLNARFGGNVTITKVENKDGEDITDRLFVGREKVDFIETDY